MSIVGDILGGGIVKPLTDASRVYVEQKGLTDRAIIKLRATSAVIASTWRPWLAKALGLCIVIYCFVWSLIFLTMFGGEMFSADWVDLRKGGNLDLMIVRWESFGAKLFDFSVVILGVLGTSRGLEKLTDNADGVVGQTIGRVARAVSGSGRKVVREPMQSTPSPIQKLAGVKPQRLTPEIDEEVIVDRMPRERHSWAWSKLSLRRMDGVNDDICELLTVALQYSPFDAGIARLGGLRTHEQQQSLYNENISPTLNSRHLHGLALDVIMYDESGKYTEEWKYYEAFYEAVQYASGITGIPFEWGGNWESRDGVHFQLPRDEYPDSVDAELV